MKTVLFAFCFLFTGLAFAQEIKYEDNMKDEATPRKSSQTNYNQIFTKLMYIQPKLGDSTDLYDESNMYPEESNANQSSLWELDSLKHHPLRLIGKESHRLKKTYLRHVKPRSKTLQPSTKDLKVDMSYDALFLQLIGNSYDHHVDLNAEILFKGKSCFDE